MQGRFLAVAAGTEHSVMLNQAGSVWSTGRNNVGQLGKQWPNSYKSTFTQVITSGVQDIAAGDWHTFVLKKDGSFWGTGQNQYGQLGDGTMLGKRTFHKADLPHDGA